MNAPAINTLISHDEVARRRKAMSKAVWSARMEGLGKPTGSVAKIFDLLVKSLRRYRGLGLTVGRILLRR